MKKGAYYPGAAAGTTIDLFGDYMYNLVDRNVRKLTARFCSILSEQDIDDIVHDAWLHVYDQRDKYRADGHLEGWIYTTCRNFVWKLTPKISKNQKLTLSYDDQSKEDYFGLDSDYSSEFADCTWSPDTLMISCEGEQRIWNAVSRLKEDDQKLVTMMVDGKRREKIAEEMGCTSGNLRVKVLRMRAKLNSYAIGA
jgi:RNA polymerase sigma factor (sigma-70 family)